LRLLFEAFARIHPAMFGQVLVMRLFGDEADIFLKSYLPSARQNPHIDYDDGMFLPAGSRLPCSAANAPGSEPRSIFGCSPRPVGLCP
jgi:hypothetical protein